MSNKKNEKKVGKPVRGKSVQFFDKRQRGINSLLAITTFDRNWDSGREELAYEYNCILNTLQEEIGRGETEEKEKVD